MYGVINITKKDKTRDKEKQEEIKNTNKTDGKCSYKNNI